MDYRTKITLLSVLLGGLSLSAVLGWAFSQQSVAQRQATEPLVPGLVTSEVTGLEAGDVVLSKVSDGWNLAYQGKTFPGDTGRIETFLKTLASNQRERLVAHDDEGTAYGLTSTAKTLKLTAGTRTLVDLTVGGPDAQGSKVFVRLAGQKEVFQTDRTFARTLDQDFNTWAHLALFPGRKPADLTRVTFDSQIETADKTVYTPFDLVKVVEGGKTTWQNRLTKASTEAMAPWADLVAGFRASAFVSPAEPAPTQAPVGNLTVAWGDGSTTALTLGAPDALNRYRLSDGTREFWVNDWALGQLLFR